jgi:hypothetical protein
MFNSMLHPEKGYDAAAEQMRKYWEESKGFEKPYMEAGNAQLPTLTGAEGALLDPSSLLAKWMSTYETSPYAKQSMSNAKSAGLDAASSMGLLGSSPAINNIQNSSSAIMNQDRQNYLSDLMQKYMTGIGIGSDIYGKGAEAAGNLSKGALGVGENMGQAAFGKQNAPGDLLKNMLAMGAKMFMASQGGGAGAATAGGM